jgi:hypothetical protein
MAAGTGKIRAALRKLVFWWGYGHVLTRISATPSFGSSYIIARVHAVKQSFLTLLVRLYP